MSLSVPIPMPDGVLRPLTSHGDGWLASPGATAQPLGTACVCQARPQLHFHLSTKVGGFPRPGKGYFESLADKETQTGAREKHPPLFLRGHGQAGGSPHMGQGSSEMAFWAGQLIPPWDLAGAAIWPKRSPAGLSNLSACGISSLRSSWPG